MMAARRVFMWPLIIIGLGCVWLLITAGTLPDATGDILLRAWPALLVLFGMDILLGRRRVQISRFSVEIKTVGMVLTLLLVGFVVWAAYTKQADVVRSENIKTFTQTLPEEITRLRLELSLERTSVSVSPDDGRDLNASYQGSRESEVEMLWSVEGDSAVLVISETRPSAIPRLEDYGRGTLDITLPVGVTLQRVSMIGDRGDVTADLQALQLERVEITLAGGDIALILPHQDMAITGALKTAGGNIELDVPTDVPVTLNPARGTGEPAYEYNLLRYDLLRDGTLKEKNAQAFQISLDYWLKDGAGLIVRDLK